MHKFYENMVKHDAYTPVNNHSLITDVSRIEEICALILLEESHIAVDTEFYNDGKKNKKWCLSLIQIAAPNLGVFIFDVDFYQERFNLHNLRILLESLQIKKIFHDYRQDFEAIYYNLNVVLQNVFDTQIAEMFLHHNRDHSSYASIVESFLQIKIDKNFQNDDWSKRPLSVGQLNYAALDVIYLIQVYEKIVIILLEKNRLSWVHEYMIDHLTKKTNEFNPVYQIRQKYNINLSNKQDLYKLDLIIQIFKKYNDKLQQEQYLSFKLNSDVKEEEVIKKNTEQKLLPMHLIKNLLEAKRSVCKDSNLKKIDKIFSDHSDLTERIDFIDLKRQVLEILITNFASDLFEHLVEEQISAKIELDHEYSHLFLILKYLLRKISIKNKIAMQVIADKQDLIGLIVFYRDKIKDNAVKNLNSLLLMKGFRYQVFGKIACDFCEGKLNLCFDHISGHFLMRDVNELVDSN